ncbi:hypothetical protein GWI72_13935 [Microvirga tunisiensis]|uniref:Flagellar assembly protein FliH/Type III secretion system HrpE domain-containing protein n=1 Tax=Pannonibacter tanglangensis TaxID=2750084 RepID=A0A7X5F415_9HYPH|nr:hypothetical protein [Pannonibacter sp. XCT-53]NBN79373.1 hypothetical protein [Pannonibacter sp. XCT-53]
MTVRSIAAHIPEFAAGHFPRLSKDDVLIADVIIGEDRQPEPTLEERLAAEYARGVRAGRQEARLEAEEDLEARVTALRSEIEAARARHQLDEADRLGRTLSAALDGLELRLADTVARILAPFVEQLVLERAVSHFRAALGEVMTGGGNDRRPVEVVGPPDLLALVERGLGPMAERVALVPGPGPEVRANLEDTVIETQIADWLGRVRSAREQME